MNPVASHYRPPQPLSAYVDLFWYYTGFVRAHAKERLLPTGTIELVINLHKVGHAELRIGECRFYLADEYPQTGELGVCSPASLGGSSFHFWLTVDDVEGVTGKAIAAGGTLLRPVEQSAQDGRRSRLRDPSGHIWTISSH